MVLLLPHFILIDDLLVRFRSTKLWLEFHSLFDYSYLNSVQFDSNCITFIDCLAIFWSQTFVSVSQFTIVECPSVLCVTERLLRK